MCVCVCIYIYIYDHGYYTKYCMCVVHPETDTACQHEMGAACLACQKRYAGRRYEIWA